jgi:hypothetical protein
MTFTRICILLSLIVAPCSFSGEATSQPTKIDSANRQFEVGKFAEAGEVYVRIATKIPRLIRLSSGWAVLRCFLTGLRTRRNGWKSGRGDNPSAVFFWLLEAQ